VQFVERASWRSTIGGRALDMGSIFAIDLSDLQGMTGGAPRIHRYTVMLNLTYLALLTFMAWGASARTGT
jgi:hypothetical protein